MFATSHSVATAVLCLLVGPVPPSPADAALASPQQRASPLSIVVQDPVLGNVRDERDGLILVLARPNVLELHERRQPRLVRVLEFPDHIVDAIIGPGAAWCIASLKDRIIHEDLVTGDRRVIAENVSGKLALNAAATHLAVFGRFFGPDHVQTFESGMLGVWVIEKEQWITRVETPILQGARPVWTDDTILVEGPDRGARYRRITGSRWLATFDLQSLQHEIQQGPLNEGWDGTWISPIAAARARSLEETTSHLSALWDQLPHARRRWSWHSLPMGMLELQRGPLIVAVQRQDATWALRIQPTGEIDFLHEQLQRLGETPHPVADRLLAPRSRESQHVMYDLVRNEELSPIPRMQNAELKRWYFKRGWLEQSATHWSYYEPHNIGPLWTAAYTRPDWRTGATMRPFLGQPVVSPGSTFIAFCTDPLKHELEVRSSADGAIVLTLAQPQKPESLHGYIIAGFDHAGERLAVVRSTPSTRSGPSQWSMTLSLYDVESGELHLHRKLEDGYLDRILALENGWWALGGFTLQILKENLEPVIELDARVRSISLIDDGNALLIVGENGDVHTIDRATGRIIASLPTLPSGYSTGPSRTGPAQAAMVFGGRALLNNTGYAGQFQILTLPDLKAVVNIRTVPLGNDSPGRTAWAADGRLGWIAWTPEGFWDASPGAEQFVAAVRGTDVLLREETDNRRSPQQLRNRISAAAGGER